MQHSKTIRYALLLAFILIVPGIVYHIPHVYAPSTGPSYFLTPVPVFTQEGLTITLVLTVVNAVPSTPYAFVFIMKDPAGKNWTSTLQSHNTTALETQFSILLVYPSTSFNGRNSLVGQYNAQVNQVKPVPQVNVASTPLFFLLTDLTEYQRTQTVGIRATGYNASESVTVTIRTQTSSTLVFSRTVTASPQGVVNAQWKIPANAVIDNYVLTVTGSSTVKTPPDVQGFAVHIAQMTIGSLSSSQSSYQRTQTMTFSFIPVYPNGTAANTGVALLTLRSPTNHNVTLTATYDAAAHDFSASYTTTRTNDTGTWNAYLAANAYSDAWGNSGPSSQISSSPQLTVATLTISIDVNPYFPVGQSISFNATITYPDGTNFQSGTVTANLVYTGTPAVNDSIPVIYDSATGLWIGNHPRGSSDPGGLWSLTMKASDSAIPSNSGSASSAVTLQDIPPYATFSSSTTSTLVGNSVSFNATGSYDPDGNIVSYSWKFGDGGTASSSTASHVFNTAGSFNVTLTVTDNSASTATSWIIVVVTTWPTTTTVTCSPLIVASGQSTSCTATVTDTSPNGPTPSGTITFSPNGVCTLSGSGTSASCSAIVNPSTTGTVSVSASYSGDTYHNANTGTVSLTVQSNSGNGSIPLYYFGILAAIIAALLLGLFLAFRRHKVTHTKLKIDLEAVKSEAGRIENQEFFQSVKDQLKKDKESSTQ